MSGERISTMNSENSGKNQAVLKTLPTLLLKSMKGRRRIYVVAQYSPGDEQLQG